LTIESPAPRAPSIEKSGRPIRESARRAFAETSDPSAYVPREAVESVLLRLGSWASSDGEGSTMAVLVGPPGLGKTFLLRVFETRSERESLYLPYAGLPPTELVDWIYGLLGRSPAAGAQAEEPSADSRRVLAPLFDLAPTSDQPFFLLIDDADSMPEETLRAFVNELPRERSTLRILMVMNEDAKASRLLAGFDSLRPCVTRLRSPMSENETGNYLVGRLSWAGAPPVEIARVDSEMTRRIFALSGGVPRMVHRIAHSHFVGEEDAVPGALDAKQRREDWMGRPFEDDPFEVDS
jgi:hypothetical protein